MQLIDWLGDVLHKQSIPWVLAVVCLWKWWAVGVPWIVLRHVSTPTVVTPPGPWPWPISPQQTTFSEWRLCVPISLLKLSSQWVTRSALMFTSINEWPSKNGSERAETAWGWRESKREWGREGIENRAENLFGWDNGDGHENISITWWLSPGVALCTSAALMTRNVEASQSVKVGVGSRKQGDIGVRDGGTKATGMHHCLFKRVQIS